MITSVLGYYQDAKKDNYMHNQCCVPVITPNVRVSCYLDFWVFVSDLQGRFDDQQ